MRVIVLLNAAAGGPNANQDEGAAVRNAMKVAGIDAEFRNVPGDQLASAAQEALKSDVDAIVAGGGDGTISAVAGAMADSDKPLGVLPLGTLNHFAKDLGLPLTLPEAVAVIAAGHTRHVDLGELNGHTFINNASIGLYPHIVAKRDRQRERLGRGKWLAMLFAILAVFKRFPVVRVRIDAPEGAIPRTTPFVFIGNNCYAMEQQLLGKRLRLDGGELGVYFANRTGRLGMLRLAIRALLGRLEQAKDFEMICVPKTWIDTSKKTLRVAMDGEVRRIVPPLEIRSRPGALRVFAPVESPAMSSPQS